MMPSSITGRRQTRPPAAAAYHSRKVQLAWRPPVARHFPLGQKCAQQRQAEFRKVGPRRRIKISSAAQIIATPSPQHGPTGSVPWVMCR